MSDKYPTAGLKPCPFCGQYVHPDYVAPCYVIHQTYKIWWSHGRIFMTPSDWNTRPLEDALTSRIAELEAAQRWIPVSEGLPEEGEEVVVAVEGGFVYPDTFDCVSEGIPRFYDAYNVTHWMPLPEPPESA